MIIKIIVLNNQYTANTLETNNIRIGDIIFILILFNELKKYEDIFFIIKTNRLPFYKDRNYIIKIITKSFFSSLYNLFNVELTTLKTYLDDILKKD